MLGFFRLALNSTAKRGVSRSACSRTQAECLGTQLFYFINYSISWISKAVALKMTWHIERRTQNPFCHPEKTKNRALKRRRFCFVQDLTKLKTKPISINSPPLMCSLNTEKTLKQVQGDECNDVIIFQDDVLFCCRAEFISAPC